MKKLKANKNFTLILISFLIGAIVFWGLVSVEKKAINPYGEGKVYVLKKPVDKNQIFTKENFTTYFELATKTKNNILDGAITDESKIIGTFANMPLYKGEQVIKSKLDSNKKRLDITNPVTINLKFTDISDIVGGVLKPGDLVHIISTKSPTGTNTVTTSLELTNIYVDKIFATDGTIIDRDNGSNSKSPAMSVNLTMSVENSLKLDNVLNCGKVKLIKPEDDAKYTGINVEGSK